MQTTTFQHLTIGDTRVSAFRAVTDGVREAGFGWAVGYGRSNRRHTVNGSYMEHYFHCDSSRYQVELALSNAVEVVNSANPGWQQWDTDQDAWYYGVWVHFSRRMIVNYAEGDLYVQIALDNATYAAEIEALRRFHGEPPISAWAIDEDGSKTVFQGEWPIYDPDGQGATK